MRLLNLFILAFLLSAQMNGQNSEQDNRSFVMGKIIDGDTIPHVMLREVTVMPPWKFKSKQEERHYGRLLVNIRKTLPYARMAGMKIDEINRNLGTQFDPYFGRLFIDMIKKEYLTKTGS